MAALIGLVIYFFKHLATVTTASEIRLAAIVSEQARTVTALAAVLTANSELLGGIKTLLMLVEEDVKHGRAK